MKIRIDWNKATCANEFTAFLLMILIGSLIVLGGIGIIISIIITGGIVIPIYIAGLVWYLYKKEIIKFGDNDV